MKLFSSYEYLKQNRLSDVIRLISVLGVDDTYSFRKNDGLTTTLNGKPKSAKDWFEIAKEHPEFFKFNLAGDNVVLLFRSLFKPNSDNKRDPLTIDQTQKLIDQAISLHDKQIARLQKNSFLMPIFTAIIASLTTGLVSFLTLKNNNESIKKIDKKVDDIILIIKANKKTTKK
ncbi:hypothetical protein [Flavobacterium sp. WG21]|uniref:hypothetical protein n=1 Tax=Flavobacterium sp. WG21 TaxID=1229487 RepID=UPI0004765569|nr:hypothetical protein [Flavobacterium sp. WG21]